MLHVVQNIGSGFGSADSDQVSGTLRLDRTAGDRSDPDDMDDSKHVVRWLVPQNDETMSQVGNRTRGQINLVFPNVAAKKGGDPSQKKKSWREREREREFSQQGAHFSCPSFLLFPFFEPASCQAPATGLMIPFYTICSNAAGVAGNLFAFVLFLSPIPTFRRIGRNRSTEQFSGLPYIYSLLNCLICFWYGLPCVSQGVILVATVNSIGAIFQLVYVTLFIIYADKTKKLKMCGLVVAVFCVFALIIYVSLELLDGWSRQMFVGYLSVATLISMFASPLCVINLVIRTRSVEFMPFYLSLSTFLMSISFFAYGMLKHDFFVYVPNGIGTILGIVQLLLYAYYSWKSRQDSSLPLLVSHG